MNEYETRQARGALIPTSERVLLQLRNEVTCYSKAENEDDPGTFRIIWVDEPNEAQTIRVIMESVPGDIAADIEVGDKREFVGSFE